MSDKPGDIIGAVGDTIGIVNGLFDLAENTHGAVESVTGLARNAGLDVPDPGVAGAAVVGGMFFGPAGAMVGGTLASQANSNGASAPKNVGSLSKHKGSSHATGPGTGTSAAVVTVDPAIKAPIVAFCKAQSDAMDRICQHLTTYCTLDGSFGLLLGVFLKPRYENSRDRAFEAFGTVRTIVDGLTTQFEGAMTDMETSEQSLQAQIDDLHQQLEDLRQGGGVGGSGGAGGSSGGYGGGGYGGGGYGGGSWAPPPPPPLPPDLTADPDETHVNVSVHVDADGDVDVDIDVDGNNSSVDVDVDVDADDDALAAAGAPAADEGDAASPDPITPIPAVGAGVGGDAGLSGAGSSADPATLDEQLGTDTIDGVLPSDLTGVEDLTAEQLAERATFYDRIWEEQAAHDPLGRSAEELRLAWESREPITLDESLLVGQTTLGYGETSGVPELAADLSLIPTGNGARS